MNFIRNAWYCCGFSSKVTTTPIREIVFGTKVVVFRTETGKVAVLEDSCPHRFVPLSMGVVRGECIECPYHGLQFNAEGACTHSPHGDGAIPKAAKVKAFPTVERDGVVWMWAGDPALADESKVLDLGELLGHGKQPVSTDFFIVEADVGVLLDNIMDLSHAPHIHRHTFAENEHMQMLRTVMEQDGDTVWSKNYIPNSRTSALFKKFRPPTEEFTDTIAHMQWVPPTSARLVVGVTPCGRPPEEGIHMCFAHMLTPIAENRTKYWWMASRNFALDNEMVTSKIHEMVTYGFTQEDEPVVVAAAKNMASTDLMALNPVLLPSDAPSIRVRRMFQILEKKEAAHASS